MHTLCINSGTIYHFMEITKLGTPLIGVNSGMRYRKGLSLSRGSLAREGISTKPTPGF